MHSFPEGCALVFGGSGGIGSSVGTVFANSGTDIALVYNSRREPADAVAQRAVENGRKATIHCADVADEAQVRETIETVIADHGRIHTIVWGAGPLVDQQYLSEISMDSWRSAFEIEVHGFFSAVQAVLPHMRSKGGGSFVHLGSAGHDWWPERDGLSVAAKAANEQLIRGIAKEEGKWNIRANSVLVGVIDAGQLHALTEQGQLDERWVGKTRELLCLKRWGTPEEIGHACVYFASDQGSYTTGQSISVAGGFGV